MIMTKQLMIHCNTLMKGTDTAMLLTKVENKDQRKRLHAMYTKYLHYLKPYSVDIQKISSLQMVMAAADEIENIIKQKNTDLIIFEEKGNDVAFAIIGQAPNAYSTMDIYIQEFCVLQNYWRKGYGTKAVKLIIDHYPKMDVSLFVLRDNAPAKAFWENVMTKMNFKELVRLKQVEAPDKSLFKPREAETDFQYWKGVSA